MSSKDREKIIGNNDGEFHKIAYDNLMEKDGKVKEKITGGNNGEFHKVAYNNLTWSE